jgi:hypothetical protein
MVGIREMGKEGSDLPNLLGFGTALHEADFVRAQTHQIPRLQGRAKTTLGLNLTALGLVPISHTRSQIAGVQPLH